MNILKDPRGMADGVETMLIARWNTAHGSPTSSPVLAEFEKDGVDYVIVQVARGTYDMGEPFAAMRLDDIELFEVD